MSHEESPVSDVAAQNLTFFAAITASLSHELKNALATINEYTGLLDDLCGAGRPPTPERLQKICGKVAKQVARSELLIKRLNRFAHSADAPRVTFNLGELLSALCDLCDRFAKLAQARLERRIPEGAPDLTSDPFALQHAVYLGIRHALAAASDQRVVTVGWSLEGGRCAVIVESADPIDEPSAHSAAGQQLWPLASYLGAELAWSTHGLTIRLAQ